ncbi:hypothetical protein FWG76_00435 [Candidatus Saccharibacteria bacterium]|nr:hypothetical protein [Candidatus Saccharibacteria bacterium]
MGNDKKTWGEKLRKLKLFAIVAVVITALILIFDVGELPTRTALVTDVQSVTVLHLLGGATPSYDVYLKGDGWFSGKRTIPQQGHSEVSGWAGSYLIVQERGIAAFGRHLLVFDGAYTISGERATALLPPSDSAPKGEVIWLTETGSEIMRNSQTIASGQGINMWTIDLREQQGLNLVSWATSTGGSGSLKGMDGDPFFIPADYLSEGVKIFIYYETDPDWIDLPPTQNHDG